MNIFHLSTLFLTILVSCWMISAVELAMEVLILITLLEPFLFALEQKSCLDMYCDGSRTRPFFTVVLVLPQESKVCLSAPGHWLYDTLLKCFLIFFFKWHSSHCFFQSNKCRFNYLNLSTEEREPIYNGLFLS